ncbi:MAG: cation:proton antiporter [Betaproteobacteria bacterium]|nr:cation:proton antiporter [Betaproteobacteria bacterium]
MSSVVLAIGLFVFAAYLFKAIFDRTGIPDVLLLMTCGLMLGPVLGWVVPAQFGDTGRVLSTLALVVILFESGVDLDLASVKSALGVTLALTLTTFAVTALVVTGVGALAGGLDWLAALTLGAILAGTSSAVVIPLVKSLGVEGRTRSVLVLESALTDVLCIVAVFLFLNAARAGAVTPGHVTWVLIETLMFAAAIGFAAGGAWLMILRRMRRLRHGTYSSVGMCFILYGATEAAGFSGAIAAISFGVMLANGRRIVAALGWVRPGRFAAFSSREHGFLMEIIFVLKTFFFVYLGISMQLDNIAALLMGGAIVVMVYAARHVLAAWLCARDIPASEVALTAAMVPKGLAAAVLAGLPVQYGMAGGDLIQAIAYAVVLLSILATALLIALQRTRAGQSMYAVLLRRP